MCHFCLPGFPCLNVCSDGRLCSGKEGTAQKIALSRELMNSTNLLYTTLHLLFDFFRGTWAFRNGFENFFCKAQYTYLRLEIFSGRGNRIFSKIKIMTVRRKHSTRYLRSHRNVPFGYQQHFARQGVRSGTFRIPNDDPGCYYNEGKIQGCIGPR